MNAEISFRFKKIFFLFFLLSLVLPICAVKLSEATAHSNLGAWAFCFFLFVIMPLTDHILGKDTTNPTADSMQKQTDNKYHSFLVLLSVVAAIGLSLYGGHFFPLRRN